MVNSAGPCGVGLGRVCLYHMVPPFDHLPSSDGWHSQIVFQATRCLRIEYKLHSLIRDHGGTTKPLANLREESIHFASFSDGQLRNWFNNRRKPHGNKPCGGDSCAQKARKTTLSPTHQYMFSNPQPHRPKQYIARLSTPVLVKQRSRSL